MLLLANFDRNPAWSGNFMLENASAIGWYAQRLLLYIDASSKMTMASRVSSLYAESSKMFMTLLCANVTAPAVAPAPTAPVLGRITTATVLSGSPVTWSAMILARSRQWPA